MKISVIIPAYNCSEYLTLAVNSVFQQTYPDWEILIAVDPGSTDQTAWLARQLAGDDSRIRVLEPGVRGVAAARNAAIGAASGRYLAFLDADDVWLPRKLQEQLEFMQAGGFAFSCTQFRRLDGRKGIAGRLISTPRRISRLRLLQQNCILCSSVMLDSSAFKFPVRFQEAGCEDFALWLKLLREVKYCHGLRRDLVRYRISENSRGASKWRSLKETLQVYREDGVIAPARALVLFPFILRGLAKYSRF